MLEKFLKLIIVGCSIRYHNVSAIGSISNLAHNASREFFLKLKGHIRGYILIWLFAKYLKGHELPVPLAFDLIDILSNGVFFLLIKMC